MSMGIGNFAELFEGQYAEVEPNIRYRFSDKLQIKYEFKYQKDNYNIGFVDIDSSNTIIYGGRTLITFTNSLTIQYIFKNDMSLNVISRHYWKTGTYSHYYNLLDNGGLEENQSYNQNNNFSYNVFNIDLVYSWQFAPGSTISLVYKNAIETEESVIESNFSKNFDNTIGSPQTNSISLKLLYYLDYQYLARFKRKV